MTLHYDPRIVVQFDASADELTSWDRWARIAAPVHVIRGAESDILTPEIAARMSAEGPKPEVIEMAGCGHAPSLSRAEDVAMIGAMLAG
ncbi:alpha/beta hydrolase [Rhodobacteraceae bacterium D3-12]|nr:alpha/beta hydrolase [Rhodobacteraceae bacterium D3-12]